MRRFTVVTVTLASTIAFLVGLLLAGQFTATPVLTSAPRRLPEVRRIDAPSVLPAMMMPGSGANFADVAERINAAVVNIDATMNRSALRDTRPYRRGGPSDFDGPSPGGAGSGFIIDRDGHILTNHHVIENAQRITVTLADGRSFRGEVVGADPAIDVALLKISGAQDLPEAPLGNSDDLRVGEWVCAIGNPLGYVHSVTVGVVSFIGRKLFDASLDDYIQTDAAINFGNSGGPLINSRGQVIGINAAVSSRTSSIGFAVPINQAVSILPQLKASGRVSRGFMGVILTDVTPPLQRALGLSVGRGALVQDFTSESAAERAGVRLYDVIVEADAADIGSNDELIRHISARQPGSVVKLEVSRDGKRVTVPVRLTERPQPSRDDPDALPGNTSERPKPPPEVPLGLSVRDLDAGYANRMNIPTSVQGVLINRVDPTGAVFSAAMRRGWIVTEINRRPVRSVAEYEKVLAAAQPGDVLAILYYDPTIGQRGLATVTVER